MEAQSGGLFQRLKSRRYLSTFTISLTLAVGILIGTVVSREVKGKENANLSADATPLQVPAPEQLSNTFSRIAKQMEPAVVNINTESTIKPPTNRRRRGAPQGDDNGNGDPFQDFFDRFFGGPTGPQAPEGMCERSLGSGDIVDPSGLYFMCEIVVAL